jgi:hypothetical protein
MRATGADPAYAKLCKVQGSFRARLTPKPWRCGSSTPPGRHPRSDADLRARFAEWLGDYERASSRYATCRFVETVGSDSPTSETRPLIEWHDKMARSGETLPLA